MSTLNLASVWEIIADDQPDALALHTGDSSRSWAEFDDRAARLASAFAEAGIGAGNNVACAMFNGNEYMETEYAAFKVRAAPCNVNYRYVEAELAYLIDNSDALAVVFDAALADRFDAIRGQLTDVRLWIQVGGEEVVEWATGYEDLIASAEPADRIERSSDDLWILYTGGTTGHPKGVMWPHQNLMAIAGRTYDMLGITAPTTLDQVPAALAELHAAAPVSRQLAASPLMHGTAGLGALGSLFGGGAVVNLTSRSFDADDLWRVVEQQRCTTISIVGDVFCKPMVEALDARKAAGAPADLSSLQSVTSSGVMWSQPIKDRLMAHASASGSALICRDSLGASEGVGFAARLSAASEGSAAATATFTLGPNAAVITEDGQRIAPGSDERGLLAVTGPIPLGYYGDPAKTAETFREFDGQRWSVPGDWATVAADGTVTLLGRGSVSINTGGEKVYPEEVEEALKLLPEVVDANVVGVPDEKWGAAVTAVVQFVDGVDGALPLPELVDRLRTELSGYKLPKHLVTVDQVKRGPNGKANYRWATDVATSAVLPG